jgi:hypothetical protein
MTKSFQGAPDAVSRGFLIVDHQQSQAVLFHADSPEFNTFPGVLLALGVPDRPAGLVG